MPIRQRRRRDPSIARSSAPRPRADVVEVHRLADRSGSCWCRTGAPACRRGTRGSARPRSAATDRGCRQRRAVGELAPEAIGEHVVAAERHLARPCGRSRDLRPARRRARRRSSRRRATSGRGGSPDGRSHPTRSAARWPACTWRSATIEPHAARVRDRPLEHLHAAHRAADHRRATSPHRGGRPSRAWARTMSRIVTTGKREP